MRVEEESVAGQQRFLVLDTFLYELAKGNGVPGRDPAMLHLVATPLDYWRFVDRVSSTLKQPPDTNQGLAASVYRTLVELEQLTDRDIIHSFSSIIYDVDSLRGRNNLDAISVLPIDEHTHTGTLRMMNSSERYAHESMALVVARSLKIPILYPRYPGRRAGVTDGFAEDAKKWGVELIAVDYYAT